MLLLERGLALGLVNTVLGLPWPPFAAQLSRVDRGVLEGTLAVMLDRLGLSPAIWLRGGGAEQPPPGTLAIAVSVGMGSESGLAWLLSTDEFLRRWWRSRGPGVDEPAPWLELAVTQLPRLEMLEVGVGDRVVFDETPALPSDGTWPVRLRWKENAVVAQWLVDGSLVSVAGGAALARIEVPTRPERRPHVGRLGPNVAATGEAVRMSVGVSLPKVDIVDLRPLRIPRTASMLLKANHKPWAFGEVTQLDGSFAVAITRKLEG
jgi:hypothetical protein